MQYFVTGATGFIGKRLVKKLLERKGAVVHFLIRKESADKVADLRSFWGVGPARAVPVFGDLTAKKLGVSADDVKKLKGQIDHFYHLAAVYDLAADEETQVAVNIEGTRNTVDLVKAIDAGHFHHVSSIAAAGLYEGVFREDMFEEAEGLDHPYFQTKHESEKIVRQDCKVPWTVYRPAMVVGDSQTGEMDKIDGPYYFFKLIQRLRQLLPPWMPTVGLEGGRVNIVPVDFVVNALNVISHQKDITKKCYHLVDPVGYRVGDVLDIFSRAAHAPRMNLFVNAALLGFIPKSVKKSLMALAPVRRVRNAVMKDLGLPEDMLTFVNYPTRFDCRETMAALKGSGVTCPNLKDYAWRLWDYWERNLDPELFIDRTLKGTSSYDRFHDYERTMQLNYFGCLRVTMGFLPGMVEKRKGHVVNISSIGVLTNAPRFSAYVASKAALDAWTRCASSEFADQGITFTTINMPLVRTPMIAPTKIYNNVPTLSPEEAADMIAQACIFKPVRIATRLGITGQLLHALVPRVAQITMNTSFRMFPDSTAAKGAKDAKPQLSAEATEIPALNSVTRGPGGVE
eukprot:gene3171-3211_t